MVAVARLMLVLTLFAPLCRAEVVINEVLVNEPGGYQSLEWIELYAIGDTAIDLEDYRLSVDEDEIGLLPGLTMAPDQYLIICRRLVSSDGVSFESRWGDSSGVWGDTDRETAMGEPVEASFSLRNSGGSLTLWRGSAAVFRFAWEDGGEDGVSFERISPEDTVFAPCISRLSSTPGALNSVTPADNDLAIVDVGATVADGLTELSIVVANRGSNPAGSVFLYLRNITSGRLLDSLPVTPLPPGDSVSIDTSYMFMPMRVHLAATIPPDDRTENDSLEFRAPGRDYPPVILSEIMPAPKTDSRAEWVEILSIHDGSLNLSGWQLGDSRKLCLISEDNLILVPNERLVLARDRSAFLAQHGHVPMSLVELDSWAQLNNGCDTVRLVDPYGLTADVFGYNNAPERNHTYGRQEEGNSEVWGESVDVGGTPGEPNRVLIAGQAPSLRMTITPQVFSPNGDGIDDTALIHIDSPSMDDITLELYDRTGRLVYDFRVGQAKANDYVWRGATNGGTPVPIGIYIVYCEVDGQVAKQAVVVARQ